METIKESTSSRASVRKTLERVSETLREIRMAKTQKGQDLEQETTLKHKIKVNDEDGDVASEPDDSDSGWDTDLECPSEIEEKQRPRRQSFDLAGKAAYLRACRKLNVTPISSLLQNIENKEIFLAHHGIGPQGAKALARALAKSTTVEKLDLEENGIQDQGAEHFAEMLKENCYITELNLAGNALNSRGAVAMSDVMTDNIYLRRLDLSFNNFNDRDAAPLAFGLKKTATLKHLRLSHNSFCEAGGEILAKGIEDNDSVVTLDLSWNHLRLKGAIAICKAIGENISIVSLDLSWNGFADEGAAAMGQALKKNNTLTELDLSHNRITKRGALELAKGLEKNSTLRVIRVGFNFLERAGTFALLRAMKNNAETENEELHINNVIIGNDPTDLPEDFEINNQGFQITFENTPLEQSLRGIDNGEDKKKKTKHTLLKIVKNYLIEKRLRAVDLFNCLDKDKSKAIEQGEMFKGLKQAQVPLSDAQIHKLIDLLDKNCNGEIDYQEFAAVNLSSD